MKTAALFILMLLVALPHCITATQLTEVKVVDQDYIIVYFRDGDVIRRDDGTGRCAFEGHCHDDQNGSEAVFYGEPLNTGNATNTGNWTISSTDDANYSTGVNPADIHRKSKADGMLPDGWDAGANDYIYQYTMAHRIYLQLPNPMQQGATYTIDINANTNTDETSVSFTYDIFNIRSEAVHVNIVGYPANSAIKAADLYYWMGDGGARDYSSFVGNTVYIYNIDTETSQEVGTVTFWRASAGEAENYNFTRSDVWNIDFTGFNTPGNYRLAVEGVGSSENFVISDDIYRAPFKVSTRGFFYMRVGQDSPDMAPRPREPLFIPGVDNTTVHITTMHPHHNQWGSFSSGDAWDKPNDWQQFSTGETNPNAWGGHSDAYDWDRHLGHVSIIWDMLLPYILTNGAIGDDDLGIAESGNGIPDVIDEARFEVDFFLRIRDGEAYSHGLTCPRSETNRVIYQAGGTAISAWTNALNSAMLAEAFRISGHSDLMQEYADSAIVAYSYAQTLPDQMLDAIHNFGEGAATGRDLKMMAAAYLYNVTGNTDYEDDMAGESMITGPTSRVAHYWEPRRNQLYGVAAYITTPRTVNYQQLQDNMRASVIHDAKQMEADYSASRPSRRATDNQTGYFKTIQNVHRCIVAHAVATDPTDIELFERTLLLEADWGLGRNGANIIQMTTASTSLESKRNVEAAYTSGYNDGTPGLHPGHTPYWNADCWWDGMIMACPPKMFEGNIYPVHGQWPRGELFFNTDYVWAHTEFTPQQTMRGKQALYGYLYGIYNESDNNVSARNLAPQHDHYSAGGSGYTVSVVSGKVHFSVPESAGKTAKIKMFDPKGRVVFIHEGIIERGRLTADIPANISKGMYIVEGTFGGSKVSRRVMLR